MKTGILAITLLLSGCIDSFVQLNKSLPTYVGRSVKEVAQRIGYPDVKQEIMGDSVFTWNTSHDSTMYLPQTTTTTGNVDGAPFSATTTGGTEAVPLHFHCMIQIATDDNGIIKNTRWSGNRGGCSGYAAALAR